MIHYGYVMISTLQMRRLRPREVTAMPEVSATVGGG